MHPLPVQRRGTGTLAYVSGTWDANTQNACSRAAGKPDDRIGVYVKARHAPMSGIIPTIYVADSSALYLEPFPATEGCVGPRENHQAPRLDVRRRAAKASAATSR